MRAGGRKDLPCPPRLITDGSNKHSGRKQKKAYPGSRGSRWGVSVRTRFSQNTPSAADGSRLTSKKRLTSIAMNSAFTSIPGGRPKASWIQAVRARRQALTSGSREPERGRPCRVVPRICETIASPKVPHSRIPKAAPISATTSFRRVTRQKRGRNEWTTSPAFPSDSRAQPAGSEKGSDA